MEWVETTGRTIDEAKDTALDTLGVAEDDAEFEVLEEPKAGLFGRVRREARVRARVRPLQPPPKSDRKRGDRRGRGKGRGKSGGNRSGGSNSGEKKSDRSKSPQGKSGGDKSGTGKSGGGKARAGSGKKTDSGKSSRSKSSGGASGGDAARDSGRSTQKQSTKSGGTRLKNKPDQGSKPRSTDRRKDQKSMSEAVSLDEHGEIVLDFVEGLVEAFGVEAEAEIVEIDDDTSEVQLHGDDLGLLIGPKGQTLQAIQSLSRTVVQRRSEGRPEGRVFLDIGGYKQKRREALGEFVTGLAEEVRDSGVEKALEPMGAADRKVVHDTVNDIDGVRTVSEGEDPRRRVVLIPEAD